MNQSCFWRSILDIQNESEELTLRLTTVVLKSNLGFLLDKILYSRQFEVLLLRLAFNFQDSCSGTFFVSHFFQNQKFYCIKPRAVKHISPIIQNNGFSSPYEERCFFSFEQKNDSLKSRLSRPSRRSDEPRIGGLDNRKQFK